MTDTSATPGEGGGLRVLAEEVAQLRDLFHRRLLEDKARQRLYDELYRQLEFAQRGLAEQYVAPLARELLLVLDRIDQLAGHGSPETRDALDSVRVELQEVLGRRGVRPVAAVGEAFDPRVHEAVTRTPVSDPAEHGRVVAQRRAGYLLEDRLLRPAQVSVGHHGDDGDDDRDGADGRDSVGGDGGGAGG